MGRPPRRFISHRYPDWVAVRAMVPRADMNRIMDELYEVGARAILVSSLLACRL